VHDAELEQLRRSAAMADTMPSSIVLRLIDEIRRLRAAARAAAPAPPPC
jgi:hypothetical protein